MTPEQARGMFCEAKSHLNIFATAYVYDFQNIGFLFHIKMLSMAPITFS